MDGNVKLGKFDYYILSNFITSMETKPVMLLSKGVQSQKKSNLMRELSAITASHIRAFEFLDEIMNSEPDKIMLDDDCIVVVGQLATYRVKIDTLLQRLRNPIVYGMGFDTISVHAKGKLDKEKSTSACIQSISDVNVPFADSIAAMIFGLLNDSNFFDSENGETLRTALIELYGPDPHSPIADKMNDYFSSRFNAIYDLESLTVSFRGTHGFKWRIGFGNPLAVGFSLEYKKPRQRYWRLLTKDTASVLEDSNGIFPMMNRICRCPGNTMPDSMDWTTSLDLCKLILPLVDQYSDIGDEELEQLCAKMDYEMW